SAQPWRTNSCKLLRASLRCCSSWAAWRGYTSLAGNDAGQFIIAQLLDVGEGVLFSDPLGGLAPCEPFELGRFDQVTGGLAGSQVLRPQLAQSLDGLVLQQQGLLGVAFVGWSGKTNTNKRLIFP